MPEQFDKLLDSLAARGLLERCEKIEAGGVSVTLRATVAPPAAKPDAPNRQQQLVKELTQAFPNAALPRSLRGEG